MQIQLESPHLEPGQQLVELVHSRFNHLGEMYDHIHHCDVVLRKEKSGQERSFIVEAKLEVPGSRLFAVEKEESFEAALRKLIDDLEHQLRKYKEELEERR